MKDSEASGSLPLSRLPHSAGEETRLSAPVQDSLDGAGMGMELRGCPSPARWSPPGTFSWSAQPPRDRMTGEREAALQPIWRRPRGQKRNGEGTPGKAAAKGLQLTENSP
uniref:Uncharacterized protein n=1 Tax=Micrurus lemniscatus lemniscatus TaxID=129467 RepID=A0A2D4I8Z8_MICLE